MIKTMHRHTFRDDLLLEGGYVLDLGCNDFIFSEYMINRGMKVIGLDPIKNIRIPQPLINNDNFTYLQKACVGIKKTDTQTYYEHQAWGANSLTDHTIDNNPIINSYEVPLTTISELLDEFNLDKFEYVKIDVEGAEYDILDNLPTDSIKQFSVEFHDWLKLNPNEDVEQYHKDLIENILINYNIEFEDKVEMKWWPTKGVFQRDDVLFVKKEL